MSNEEKSQSHPETADHGKVTVTVDTIDKLVRPGAHVVSEFKAAVGVPAEKALDQVIDGRIEPLEDAARVNVHGGEKFVSHARRGGSS